MAKPVTIKILGDASGFDRAVSGVNGKLGDIGRAAGVATAAVAAAATAAAASAVQAAVDFETELAQVFTLLPGLTDNAMASMQDEVLSFSNEVGLLPDEVVPALYDALSAGVPRDNVFAFLGTASQAAIGGNLDLQASVDLLTTATNAYAESGLTASEASDMFFTTVRLGKTTVPELQAAFSNVGPIAASLGVGLDEVGAAMATLTAAGVPTAQAATQIRAVLADLAKTGTKADTAFRELSGESFVDFIDNGGTLEEALEMVSEGGLSVVDTFGRIEGAGAVMTLLTDDMGAFSSALDEMSESAGATEAAFDVMEDTSARSLERLSTMFATARTELGLRLLPVLERLIEWGQVNIPQMREAVQPVFDWLLDKFEAFRAGLSGDGDGESFFERYGVYLRETLLPVLKDVLAWVQENGPRIAEFIGDALLFVMEEVVPRAIEAFKWVKEAIGDVVDFVRAKWPAVQEVITSVVDYIVEDIWPVLRDIFNGLVDLVGAVVDQLIKFWETWGEKIWNTVKNTLEPLKGIVEAALGVIRGVIETITGLISGDWERFWDGITDTLRSVVSGFANVFEVAWGLFKLAFDMAWEGLKSVVRETMEAIVEFIVGLPGRLLDFVATLATELWGIGWDLAQGIAKGFLEGIKGLGEALLDAVNPFGGPNMDSVARDALASGVSEQDVIDQIYGGNAPDWLLLQASANANPEGFSLGGFWSANSPALVGERGPELIIPNDMGGADVIPSGELGGAADAASGGVTVNVNTAADPWEIGAEVAWQLRRVA